MTDGNADEQWMAAAIAEARLAEAKGEVPVGAVIVHEGQVIGRGHNLRESSQDPTTHAEMIAIQEAAKKLGSWRLIDTSLYVTLEPCPMCAGALVNARVPRVVWGCDDPKAGATQTLYRIGSDARLNHRFELRDRASSTRSVARFLSSLLRGRSEASQEPPCEKGA